MADKINVQNGDTVVVFSSDEYAALLSLLYELQDESKLEKLAEATSMHISRPQIKRITSLWSSLVQKRGR